MSSGHPKPPSHPPGYFALGSSYCQLTVWLSFLALITLAPYPLLLMASLMLGPPTIPQGVHWHQARIGFQESGGQDEIYMPFGFLSICFWKLLTYVTHHLQIP